ncbi:MAG TPA: ComEC/Rec2 family competence protein, partial [Candidatus Hydrogenedentes bacterium]|nr:ComEC/Rec2 family competence protein [Candidatus Hydrogenedentota bacterium]
MRRPWVWVALSMMTGLYAAGMGWISGIYFPLIILGIAALVFLCLRNLPYRGYAVCILVFFACGALCWNAQQTGPAGDALSQYSLAHPDTEFVLEGVVSKASLMLPGADRQRCVLSVNRMYSEKEWMALSGGVLITLGQPDTPLHAGEHIRVRGRLQHWLGPVNHGTSGVEDYY